MSDQHRGEHDHHHDDHHHHDHAHDHGTGWRRVLAVVTHPFTPHSHDAADSVDAALEASDEGIRAVKLSLVGLGATAGLQLLVVLVSGSVALLADTVHNFSDALTAVPLWIAFVLARRAASRRYTYGYGRAEDLAGLFIVGMIALSALVAAVESVQRLLDPQEVEHLVWVAAAGVIGFAGNELVAVYRIKVGRRIGSVALVADGLHARADGLTSLAVVAGAAGVAAGFPLADPLVGLVITVAICFVLRSAGSQVWRRLMDGVEPEVLASAERALAAHPAVLAVDRLRMRWVGHRLLAEVEVRVPDHLTVAEGHEVAHAVQTSLVTQVPRLTDATVHVGPA